MLPALTSAGVVWTRPSSLLSPQRAGFELPTLSTGPPVTTQLVGWRLVVPAVTAVIVTNASVPALTAMSTGVAKSGIVAGLAVSKNVM